MSCLKSLVVLAAVSILATQANAREARNVTYQQFIGGTCTIPSYTGGRIKIGMNQKGKGLYVNCLPDSGILVITELSVKYNGDGTCDQRSSRNVQTRFVDPVQCAKISAKFNNAKEQMSLAIEDDGSVRLSGRSLDLVARPIEKAAVDGIKDAAKILERETYNALLYVEFAANFVSYKVKQGLKEFGSAVTRIGNDPSLCTDQRNSRCRYQQQRDAGFQ